jgi:hypothetical protein
MNTFKMKSLYAIDDVSDVWGGIGIFLYRKFNHDGNFETRTHGFLHRAL